MASSVSALSYLDPSAYQGAVQPASTTSTGSGGSAQTSDTGGLIQLQALQQQGELQAFLSNSVAAALLQPTPQTSGSVDSTTLIDSMLQQVLGAYNAQASSNSG